MAKQKQVSQDAKKRNGVSYQDINKALVRYSYLAKPQLPDAIARQISDVLNQLYILQRQDYDDAVIQLEEKLTDRYFSLLDDLHQASQFSQDLHAHFSKQKSRYVTSVSIDNFLAKPQTIEDRDLLAIRRQRQSKREATIANSLAIKNQGIRKYKSNWFGSRLGKNPGITHTVKLVNFTPNSKHNIANKFKQHNGFRNDCEPTTPSKKPKTDFNSPGGETQFHLTCQVIYNENKELHIYNSLDPNDKQNGYRLPRIKPETATQINPYQPQEIITAQSDPLTIKKIHRFTKIKRRSGKQLLGGETAREHAKRHGFSEPQLMEIGHLVSHSHGGDRVAVISKDCNTRMIIADLMVRKLLQQQGITNLHTKVSATLIPNTKIAEQIDYQIHYKDPTGSKRSLSLIFDGLWVGKPSMDEYLYNRDVLDILKENLQQPTTPRHQTMASPHSQFFNKKRRLETDAKSLERPAKMRTLTFSN